MYQQLQIPRFIIPPYLTSYPNITGDYILSSPIPNWVPYIIPNREKANGKQEEFWMIRQLEKTEKIEREKEELYEICYNLILKKQEEKEKLKKEKRVRLARVEIKRKEQRKANTRRCGEILKEIIETMVEDSEEKKKRTELKGENMVRKRTRTGM